MSVSQRSTASRDSSQKIKVHHRPADISKVQQSDSVASKTTSPRSSLGNYGSPIKKLDFLARLSPSKTVSEKLSPTNTVSEELSHTNTVSEELSFTKTVSEELSPTKTVSEK